MSFALLLGRTPTQRDVTRFGVDRLALSVKVTIIDASALLGREHEVKHDLDLPRDAVLVGIRSLDDLIRVSEENRMTILLDTLPPGNVRCEVRTVLHALDIKVARHAIGPIPPLPRPSIGTRIVERMPRSRRDAKRVADLILEKVRPSRGPLVDFFIAAGESSLSHHDANSAMFTIDGRSLDCDEYERAARDSVRGSRYGVFVDSGGPAHPDFELLGIKPSGKTETYFATLRSFLEKAQDATGLPIVIARHPRMTRVNYSDYLPDFEVQDSVTAMSVRGSEFVLDSGSTATSFSVLGSKPIIYVAPGARPGAIDWRPASAFATSLGLPVHHELASFADSLAGTLRVDHDQYERYRRLYLFSDGSTRRTFAEEMMTIIDQHGLS